MLLCYIKHAGPPFNGGLSIFSLTAPCCSSQVWKGEAHLVDLPALRLIEPAEKLCRGYRYMTDPPQKKLNSSLFGWHISVFSCQVQPQVLPPVVLFCQWHQCCSTCSTSGSKSADPVTQMEIIDPLSPGISQVIQVRRRPRRHAGSGSLRHDTQARGTPEPEEGPWVARVRWTLYYG